MKYIFKNIASFFKQELLVLFLVIFCVSASSVVLHFSYGLYQHYYYNLQLETGSTDKLDRLRINIVDYNRVTKQALLEALYTFPEELKQEIVQIIVFPMAEPYVVEPEDRNGPESINLMDIRFCISENHVTPSELAINNMRKYMELGFEPFTAEQEANGDRIAVISQSRLTQSPPPSHYDDAGNFYLEIQGKDYLVVGYCEGYLAPLIPFQSLDDNTPLCWYISIGIEPNSIMKRSQYDTLRHTMTRAFGDAVSVAELDLPDDDSMYLYRTVLVIAVLIAVLAAINFSLLYRFILSKRQKTVSIFRLCGCTKRRAVCTFLGECLLMILPIYALSTLLYAKVLLPMFGKTYEHMEGAYSPAIYAIIFAIYIGSSVIVLIRMMNRAISNYHILDDTKGGRQ